MEKLSHVCPATIASKLSETRFESEALQLPLPKRCPSALLLSQRHLWRACCVHGGANTAPREHAWGRRFALQRAWDYAQTSVHEGVGMPHHTPHPTLLRPCPRAWEPLAPWKGGWGGNEEK